MIAATSALRILIRAAFTVELVLGLLFWSGKLDALTPVHELLGVALVVGLWGLAIIGAFARISRAIVVIAILYGLMVPVLGDQQSSLVPGRAHSIIQVIHLASGLGLLALAEWLGSLIRHRGAHLVESRGNA